MAKKYNEIEAKNNMHINVDVEVDGVTTEEATEKKQIERLVTIQPKKVKRSLLGRLVSGVLGPDGLPSIGAYVNDEIIKPAVKNLVFDTITSAATRAIFGEKGNPYRGNSRPTGGVGYSRPNTNYSNHYNGSRPADALQVEGRKVARPSRYGVEEYIIPDRYDAANILTSLTEYADRYDKVSVADYYETIGAEAISTDHNYGWTIDSITHATIVAVRGGFVIKFPPVEVI